MSTSTGVPGWLIFVGSTAVALVFTVGLVVLLILGRAVPEQLWVLSGVIATAYFGSGPFWTAHQQVSATNRSLIDTLNHTIATLRDGMAVIGASSSTTGTATNTHGDSIR